MARMSISTAAGSATYRLRRKLPDNVVGNALFSWAWWPGPLLRHDPALRLGDGTRRCVVSAPKWFGIHNHIGTFHAIAACNLAEVAMGMLMEATTPPPTAGSLGHVGAVPDQGQHPPHRHRHLAHPIDFATITEGTDVVVSIEIRDTDGIEVVHCDITTWVTPPDLSKPHR